MAGFHGRGPGGFGLDGNTHQLRIEDDGTTLKVIVPLAGLQTGIGLRDKHMREKYLEVDKYPDAVLEVPWSGVKLPGDGQTGEGSAPGKMTLHGKSKDVQVKYRIVRTGHPLPGDRERAAEPQGLRHRRAELPRGDRAAGHRRERVLHRGALLSPRARWTRSAAFLPLALLLAVVLPAASAHAYPWMIQHGYTNCSTCHVEPSGFGLLTEYGRAQAQISIPTLWGGKKPDEVEPFNGILYGAVPLPSWLNVGLSLRGAVLSTTTSQGTNVRDILMIADLRAGVTAGPFLASVSFGYVPTGATLAAVTNQQRDNLVSREHWLGLRFDDNKFYVLGGRLNLPFGLRNVEHNSFVRAATRTDTNSSQQYGGELVWDAARHPHRGHGHRREPPDPRSGVPGIWLQRLRRGSVQQLLHPRAEQPRDPCRPGAQPRSPTRSCPRIRSSAPPTR